jgi:hypothetical protein
VDEYDNFAGRGRVASLPVQHGLDRQRIVRRCQVIAHDAVERGEHGFAFGGRGRGCEQCHERRQRQVDGAANQACDAAHAAVDKAGDAACAPRRWGRMNLRSRRDCCMHRLHQVGDARRRRNRQPADAANI